MKVVLVSFFFGGERFIGGSRAAHFAEGLRNRGHEVLVVNGKSDSIRHDKEVIPVDTISVGCIDLEAPVEISRKVVNGFRGGVSSTSNGTDSFTKRIGLQPFRDFICFPDRFALWAPWVLIRAGRRIRKWKPDIVLSSSPPFSSHVLGMFLGKMLGLPVVLDYRDLYVDNPYSSPARWRRALDGIFQRAVARRISTFITNSGAMAARLEGQLGRTTEVVFTGYRRLDPEAESRGSGGPMFLVHTGTLYGGKRSPTGAFSAIRLLANEGIDLRFILAGDDSTGLSGLVDEMGIADRVQLLGRVSSSESTALQRRADVLVVLLWSHPSEELTMTGKVMEYIERRKPILVIGPEFAAVSRLVQDYGLGFVANSEGEVAECLRKLWVLRSENETATRMPTRNLQELSLENQSLVLECILRDAVDSFRLATNA